VKSSPAATDDRSLALARARALVGLVVTIVLVCSLALSVYFVLRLDGGGVPAIANVILALVAIHIAAGSWFGVGIVRAATDVRRRYWLWAAPTLGVFAAVLVSANGPSGLSGRALLIAAAATVTLGLTNDAIQSLSGSSLP
jgi:hypothetical protein